MISKESFRSRRTAVLVMLWIKTSRLLSSPRQKQVEYSSSVLHQLMCSSSHLLNKLCTQSGNDTLPLDNSGYAAERNLYSK